MSGNNPAYNVLSKKSLVVNHTTATTTNGTGVDCRGYDQVALVVTFGDVTASAAGNATIKIQESSDDGAGDAYADVTSATTGALVVGNALDNTTRIITVDPKKTERWLRAVLTTSGNETAVPLAATFLLANGKKTRGSADYSQFVSV